MNRYHLPPVLRNMLCYDRQRFVRELRYEFSKLRSPEELLLQLPAATEFVRERGDRLASELPTCLALLDLLSTWDDDPRYVEYRQAVDGWMTEHPGVQLPPMRRLKPLSSFPA